MWFLVTEKGLGILDGIWRFLFQSDFFLGCLIGFVISINISHTMTVRRKKCIKLIV